jgi:hypothetical protein
VDNRGCIVGTQECFMCVRYLRHHAQMWFDDWVDEQGKRGQECPHFQKNIAYDLFSVQKETNDKIHEQERTTGTDL